MPCGDGLGGAQAGCRLGEVDLGKAGRYKRISGLVGRWELGATPPQRWKCSKSQREGIGSQRSGQVLQITSGPQQGKSPVSRRNS